MVVERYLAKRSVKYDSHSARLDIHHQIPVSTQ